MAVKKSQVLSDRFEVGENIGRGAYGQVHRGTDLLTGETVAIKRISLAGIPADNLQSVMGEIDLLKTLNHKNIVKYLGSFKSRTDLFIILEYMENGSLASLIKPNKFGTFPETLAAVYIAQVLQGLQYLHEQGVVHRDIKGANILTTKDGLVKLADFGVAAKLGELEERPTGGGAGQGQRVEEHAGGGGGGGAPVVGTPYWMAPEVIEMTQVTSSSDIWSVGCLVLELITGLPPYFELNTMSAMFRIVQDAMPPLPEDISPLLRDFLSRCFLKDAKLRPDARTLLRHEWLQHTRRTLRVSWRRDQGAYFRTLVRTRAAAKHSADTHETISSVVARMVTAADEEEATAAARAAGGGGVTGSGGGAPPAGGSSRKASESDDATAALLGAGAAASTSPLYGAPPPPGPLAAGTLPYAPAAAADLGPPQQRAGSMSSAAAAMAPLPPPPPVGSPPPPNLALQRVGSSTPTPLSPYSPAAVRQGSTAASPLASLIHRMQGEEPLAAAGAAGQQADGAGGGRPAGHDLAAWADGGGHSHDAGRGGAARQMGGPEPGALFDGPAGYEAEYVGSSLTTQATELRRTVRDLVRALRPPPAAGRDAAAAAATSARAAAALLDLLAPPLGSAEAAGEGEAAGGGGGGGNGVGEVKSLFLGEGGVLVLMELLDSEKQQSVEAALDLLSALTAGDPRLLESLCLVGLLPAVARYTQAPHPGPLRLRAAGLVHTLCCGRDSTLQLFIAAGGLRQLCCMVADGGPAEPSHLSLLAIQCLLQVLQCYATLPLNYICRITAHCGLLPRLYRLLKEVIAALRRHPQPPQPPQYQTVGGTAAAVAGSGKPAAAASPAAGPGSSPASPSAKGGHAHAGAGAGGSGPYGRSASGTALLADLAGGGARAGGGGGGGGTAAGAGGPRAMTLPAGGSAAAGARGAAAGPVREALSYEELSYLLDKTVLLLAVLSNADGAVKAAMATHDNLLQHLDCLSRLQPPHQVELLRCLRNLTSDPAVLPAIKDAGAIACLVPLLADTHALAAQQQQPGAAAAGSGASGLSQASSGGAAAAAPTGPDPTNRACVAPKSDVQMEALSALYNLCMFNKKVHLEVAAAAGIVPHLCSLAAQGCAAVTAARAARQASAGGAGGAAGASPSPSRPGSASVPSAAAAAAAGGGGAEALTPGSAAALAAAAAQWPAVRGYVVPLMLGLVVCSPSTRSRLHASRGLDIFLHLLSDEDSRSVLGVLQGLDSWLAEDHGRVEARLTGRDAVGHLVHLYARSCNVQDMQSKLEALRTMLGRSAKLAVALAIGGLVPWLLAMIQHAAPINRVKILDIVRILYEHYPRPKEFIMMYKIQDVLALLLRTHGRDADAVIQQAQRLLSAFDINVLL